MKSQKQEEFDQNFLQEDVIEIGKVYTMKKTNSTKEGYGGKKVRVIDNEGMIPVELLEDIIVNGKLIVGKGTILSIFHTDDLIPVDENKWTPQDEVKKKYIPILNKFIEKIERSEKDEVFHLSNTELNPYTLMKILEDMGYEQSDISSNGWQMDFWITLTREGFKTLCIGGTGITFEMKLSKA